MPIVSFLGALAFLILARIAWSPHAFYLLTQPLFFVLALCAVTLVFYYILLGYLLLRGRRDPSPPPSSSAPLL